jgi:hypothetical protein
MTSSTGKWLVKNQKILGLVIFGFVVSDSCSSVRVVFVTGKGYGLAGWVGCGQAPDLQIHSISLFDL